MLLGIKADTIVAYTYTAEILCRPCMRKVAAFDAEANGRNAEFVSLETLLDEWATRQGIDRMDERSFDSGDFPKVVFACQVEDDETCTRCGHEVL